TRPLRVREPVLATVRLPEVLTVACKEGVAVWTLMPVLAERLSCELAVIRFGGAELTAPPVLVRVTVVPLRASTVSVPLAVALTAPAVTVPNCERVPPLANSVRAPPAVLNWPTVSLVLALRVR